MVWDAISGARFAYQATTAFCFVALYLHSVWSGEPLILNIAGIASLSRFKDQNFGFSRRRGSVLDPVWNYAELSRFEPQNLIAKLNRHLTAPHEEQFILTFMDVPREHTLKLYELHFLSVQFRCHFWPPMLAN
jgi:hypothetical protein